MTKKEATEKFKQEYKNLDQVIVDAMKWSLQEYGEVKVDIGGRNTVNVFLSNKYPELFTPKEKQPD